MSTETKVGAFVLAGLILLGVAIFLLGDYTFEKRYTVRVVFNDVSGLSDKSPIKLSGVEVGKVKSIELADTRAAVVASIRQGVPIYRDAVITIGSTGLIGSKFLEVDQGHPAAGVYPPGSTIEGTDPVSIEKAITKALASLQDLLGGLNGDGKQGALTKNLNATIAHVRSLTANLDEMFADAKPHISDALTRMDSITAKLDSVLAKADEMMAAINTGKGPVGALMHDEKMKTDVKETVASLREAAGTAKDVLGRMTQFRVYWNYDWRYEHLIRTSRADVGLKIVPRDGRYYYLGGSNIGNVSDLPRNNVPDYAKKNTVDALLGFEWGGVDLGVGVLRSGGGGKLTWTPVPDDPILGRFSVMGEAFDFGRNRVVNGKRFDKPEYDFGAQVRLHKMIKVGGRVEDVQTTKRYQSWVNVNFEDRDIAYLFGLISFGAAGTKGRSKSSSGGN